MLLGTLSWVRCFYEYRKKMIRECINTTSSSVHRFESQQRNSFCLSKIFTVNAVNLLVGLAATFMTKANLCIFAFYIFRFIDLWLSFGVCFTLLMVSWHMQRWATIKKQYGNLNLGSNSIGSQLSEAQLRARRAMSLALDMSVKSLAANSVVAGISFNHVMLFEFILTASSGYRSM